jgi:hypothetical protein
MDNEHQDAAPAHELDQARAFLLAQTTPAAAEPVDALRLLAELDAEADELYALAERGTPAALDDIAGYRRRRAYVWVHLAQQRPEFEAKARAEAGVITTVAAAARR